MTGWLLAFGRPVLWPLVISALCRVTELTAGAALLGFAAYTAVTAISTGTGSPATAFAVVVALATLKGLFHYLEHYTGHWVAFRVLAMMRVFFYERLAALAPAVSYRHRTGDLLARVTRDIDRLEVFFAHSVVPAVAAVVMPAGVLVWFAAAGSPVVAAAVAPFFVALGAIVPFLGRQGAQRAESETVRFGGVVSAHLADTIAGLREVTAYGAGERRLAEQAAFDDEAASRRGVVARWVAVRAAVTRVTQVAVVLTVVAIGHAVDVDSAVVAAMAAVTVATFPALAAVEGFAALLGSTRSSVQRVRAIADEEPDTPDVDASTAWIPGTQAPQVHLDNVDFVHPGGSGRAPVLTRTELTIPAGATVGLLGPTGSGKSTIGALLARIWDPTGGRVLWDGHDLRHIPLAELRRRVTVVDQEPFLLRASIAANLRLAAPDASDSALWDVLRSVDLEHTVRAMPDGLDTSVGERGAELSGGQRQRLALARALLHDGRLVIVDEGTSQLDEGTEARVLDRLQSAWADRTVLWITHRPSTLRLCDTVFRIDAGEVVPWGDEEELLAAAHP
ncbi:thiol reductant ABC exporter subunit CydC [Rhodococcus sp. NPDC060086]|uniref:thiol reductant ABC exporter subunit CydC n=1 Tax=Rhodococcus sp. NPDC060086 TaxID=3347055 RepID=UPI00365B4250